MAGSLWRIVLVAGLLGLGIGSAVADDWVAAKLRGRVLERIDGTWHAISRGDVVPDGHAVRTVGNSRVLLVRGKETIELGPNTLIEIRDRDGELFTTVRQAFGEIKVEADVRNVEHFAVETPHLAAVVKGTIFVVRSGRSGAQVEVERGRVAVEDADDHSTTIVAAGQSASAEEGSPLEVSGAGELPVVKDASGEVIPSDDAPDAGGQGKSGKSDDDESDDGKSKKSKSGGGWKDDDENESGSGGSGRGKSGKSDDDDDDDDEEDDDD
ncbi:FecR domain-containing protein [Devosia sp.]|uniref:FecR domain-containing protein n=1 Tax=Devosia sp. TaxID=1871048 RepID=UPI0035B03B4C